MSEDSLRIIGNPNKRDWSEFVYKHPLGNIYQTPEMAEVYRRTKNYEPIVLAVVNETDEIVAIMLATIVKEAGRLMGPFTARSIIPGGPLFVGSAGARAVSLLLRKYEEIVKKRVLYSEIRMLHEASSLDPVLKKHGFVFEDHFNALIDLSKSKEELWKQLKRDRQRGIRKAMNLGITIERCDNRKNLKVCYSLIKETYKRARIPLADITLFEAAFDVLRPKDKALFLFAVYNGRCIATQIALVYKDTIYAWYTGAIKEYLKYHPGDLLIWHLLEWGSENGFKTFDFGGGGSPTKNVNIRYYKSRFGCKFFNYGRYKKIHSPIKMNLSKMGFKIYRNLVGKMR